MCGISALRAGAGLVRLYVPAEIYVPVASSLTEVMVASFDSKGFPESPGGLSKIRPELAWADIIALGSGLSLRADLQEVALSVLINSEKPVIADAEGCFAAKRWLLEYGHHTARIVILTPHIGEFAKLAEISLETALGEPEKYALELSQTLRCYVLLKSDSTFLATPNGYVLRPPAGSPALAKGGSGDVLVGALAARTAIALRAWKTGLSPYADYLTNNYYLNYPTDLLENSLPVLEGIMRGYSLYAQASHNAARLAGSEESVLATEVAELLNAETEWHE
jgi:NAD(P)H-hydrate epimerase